MSIILCMSSCIVLFAYSLLMLITAILLSRSCPIVDLTNVLMRRRALKDLSAEHEVAGIAARMEATLQNRQNVMETILMHGLYHLCCILSLAWVPAVVVFKDCLAHLIAFHYPRHRNLIQFGCCWCLENGWIRFRPMHTKPPGHCPQTLIEVHWRLCQHLCTKLWYESEVVQRSVKRLGELRDKNK